MVFQLGHLTFKKKNIQNFAHVMFTFAMLLTNINEALHKKCSNFIRLVMKSNVLIPESNVGPTVVCAHKCTNTEGGVMFLPFDKSSHTASFCVLNIDDSSVEKSVSNSFLIVCCHSVNGSSVNHFVL